MACRIFVKPCVLCRSTLDAPDGQPSKFPMITTHSCALDGMSLIGIEKLHSVKLLSVFEFMYLVFIYTLNYFVTQSFYLAFLSDFLYPKM